MNRILIGADGLSAGKYNVLHTPIALIGSLWSEHPGVSSLQAYVWPIEVEEREAHALT